MDSDRRMMTYNNLVVRVLRAQGLQLKHHKSLEVYVSLATSGKGLQYKSKVHTNPTITTDGSASWDESCEFQLNELENELQVHVCHKGRLGTTEHLGSLHFDMAILPQFQPPKAFKLTKKGNDDKDRGVIFLGFEFANKIAKSVSNFSINTVNGTKENKLDKLKRKMHFGRRKNKDAQSMASVSLSRRSSFSSVTSALAFSSPSPNQMHRNDSTSHLNHADALEQQRLPQLHVESSFKEFAEAEKPPPQQMSPQPSLCSNPPEPKGFRTKMREKAEKLLHGKHGRKNSADFDTASVGNLSFTNDHRKSATLDPTVNFRHRSSFNATPSLPQKDPSLTMPPTPLSRPTSIASSSGFASLGSNNVSALNENTSPEYLLKVIEHLRKELYQKDAKIRDLQDYLDKLLSRVIETHPELLQVSRRTY